MRRLAVLALVAACAARPAEPLVPIEPDFQWHVHSLAVAPPENVPTFRLPRDFLPTGYRARLALGLTTFDGEIEIDGTLSAAAPVIWLNAVDLHVNKAIAKRGAIERPLVATSFADFLALQPAQPLEPGAWTISLVYTGEIRRQERPTCSNSEFCDVDVTMGVFRESADFIYTQSEPLGARRIFPCFDEPDVKVPWQLTLVVDAGALAVSNTPIARETVIGRSKQVEFAPTAPLPSYLVAFAVGPFHVVEARKTKHGTPIRILVPFAQTEAGEAAREVPRIVENLEDYTQVPFPYPKLDIVGVPFTGEHWGAMENAGLITCNVAFVSERGILAHEIAHQWFGDLVTLAWWDDAWLNESFATWAASKIAGSGSWWSSNWSWPQDQRAVHAVRAPMHDTHGERGIVTYLDGSRGAAVIRMFESFVGEDVFQRAIHAYLVEHANGNATSADLIRAVDVASGQSLDEAFASALDRTDTPEIATSQHCHALDIEPRTPAWVMPVCVSYDRDGMRDQACTMFGAHAVHLDLPAKRCPHWVIPNADGAFIYADDLARHDATSWFLSALPVLTPHERSYVLGTIRGDDAQRLSWIPKLLGYRDLLGDVVSMLVPELEFVPPDLVPAIEGQLHAIATSDPKLAGVVDASLALLGDPKLDQLAWESLAEARRSGVRYAPHLLRAAAITHPRHVAELLDGPKSSPYERVAVLTALAHSPKTLDELERDPAFPGMLTATEMTVLLSGACDSASRARAIALSESRQADKEKVGKNIDTCISRRAKLEPIFRAWLSH